jgi:EAL domain-containing protein (putative c-di-GMP-specific phosphodiesterase class I)
VQAPEKAIRSILSQLTVYLQPVFDLETGKVEGFETLLRPHPWSGMAGDWNVPDFYLRAEAEGFLTLLEETARELAFRAARQHLLRGERLFLNLDERVPLRGMERGVRETVVEVLEGRQLSGEMLAELSRLACPIYLDDFGSGRANLDRLLEIRPAGIKIASQLVRGVAHDKAREALLRAIVEIARAVGADVVEGVEVPAELETIYRVGIRRAQGFLLGRPVPVPDRKTYARVEAEILAALPRGRWKGGRGRVSRPEPPAGNRVRRAVAACRSRRLAYASARRAGGRWGG